MLNRLGGVLVLCCVLADVSAADIGVTGNWTALIGRNDLVAGAGSDLRSPIESVPAQTTLEISATAGGAWTVKVLRNDLNWPPGVSIAVRRTSAGSGPGTISGGTAYVTLSGTEQTFFTGTGDRSDIALQLKTEGLSVQASPDNYITTITYRIE